MLAKLKFDEQGEMRTVRGAGPYKKFRDGGPSRNWGLFLHCQGCDLGIDHIAILVGDHAAVLVAVSCGGDRHL